ncbi:hypothetical protein Tco_0555226, partial [Tanacetum coccineum]
ILKGRGVRILGLKDLGSKAREREVSDAKGNSSMKASVVITRPSCLIDSPSIIQSRKQSQRPLKKDDFYFKICRDGLAFPAKYLTSKTAS